MAARLGQPVVIETRSGAGGMTGVDVAAKAPADGYTVALGTTGAIVIGPSLTRNPPFVAERDLAPITLAINVQVPIVVPAPGLFSTTTFTPQASLSFFPTILPRVSLNPPGG
jgi:tripartite-type tricarboxylate transporter receptor subunit TctC